MKIFRRVPADYCGQDGLRALFDPDRKLTDLQFFDSLRFPDLEGILNEITNGGKHARNQVRILRNH